MATTQAKKEQKALLATLAELGGKLTAEEDILFQGTKLILPERMTPQEAVKFLEDKIDEDEREMSFSRTFPYRPWDGAHATMAALKKLFGAVTSQAMMTMFGPEPPELRTINTDFDKTAQVPWGILTIPLLPDATFQLAGSRDQEMGVIFAIHASGPRKYRFQIEGIFRAVEAELRENSIYRGKAFDGQEMPKFLDLRGFDQSKVVYSQEVLTQLDANVWSVMTYADEMKAIGMPLKRAVLLEGPYGTGKTLAATWTARVALEAGWTFISCRPGRDDLFTTMQTAKLYQPAVVFFEDVDTIAEAGTDRVSELLDVFDGIQSKDTRIIAVLTTNHVEQIHKGMVRPGRLDAVIHIGELDEEGFMRLIEAVVPTHNLAGNLDRTAIAEAFHGFLPAFAKEAIDRALRYNLARNKGHVTVLETADFVEAAHGLRPQLELMHGAKEHGDGVTIDNLISTASRAGISGVEIAEKDNEDYVPYVIVDPEWATNGSR